MLKNSLLSLKLCRTSFYGLIALGLAFTSSIVTASATWEGSLDEETYLKVLEAYKKDPGALANHPEVLEKISTDQLRRAIESMGLNHFTYLYPMVIRTEDEPSLEGLKVDEYDLMAVRGGKLISIPFQVDEFDVSGLIYIKGASPKKLEGKEGIFDANDQFVFMYRDAGHQRYSASAHGKHDILKELHITVDDAEDRYAYLVKSTARANADYVNVDLDTGVVETTLLKLEFEEDNHTQVESIVPKAGPNMGQNVLDNIYVDVSTGIFNENLRVSLNTEKNIRAVPIGVKDGPVRATILLKVRIFYAGLPVYKEYINVNYYEQAFNIPSRLALDSINAAKYFAVFLKEPRIHFALDFHNLNGAKLTFDSIDEKGGYGVVDGQMSNIEHEINKARLPGDWLWLDSNQGWNFFFSNHLPVVEKGIFDQFLEGMMVRVHYEDDPNSTTPYERYPGASPRFGVQAEGIPTIALDLISSTRGVDFDGVENVGDLLYALQKAANKGKLKKIDKITQKIYDRMIAEGRLKTSEDLAKMYVADLDRMGFKGIDKKILNEIWYEGFAKVEDINNIRVQEVLNNIIAAAEQRNVDITDIQYAIMDNTLWFPDTVGAAGPAAFHQQVKYPPSVKFIDFAEQQVAGN